jgi:hypothetical protein
MSATWQFINAVVEAPEDEGKKLRGKILSYLANNYGREEAEATAPFLRQLWNPEGLEGLYKTFTDRYQDADGNPDPEIERFLRQAISTIGRSKGGGATALKRKKGSDVAEPAVGVSRKDKIAGLSSGDYISPDEFQKQKQATAATAASRPDRAGTQANIPAMKPSVFKPGERPQHDIGLTPSQAPGAAPGHTRPVQKQVSQQGDKSRTVKQQMDYLQGLIDKDPDHPQADKIKKALDNLSQREPDELLNGPTPIPTSAGSDLEGLRASLEDMKKRQAMLPDLIRQASKRAVALRNTDPTKSQELARKVGQMRAEFDELPKKMRDAEQRITRITQSGKSGVTDAQRQVDRMTAQYGEKIGAKLAKKLGVPSTGARTVTATDPDTGEEKKKVNVWSAEKVAKWIQGGMHDLAPGVYDMPGGPKLPEPEKQHSSGPAPLRKPMMKAPKGLDFEGQKHLADLRRQFAKLKKGGASQDELQLVKQEIDKIMASGSELVDVVMPGAFDGQVARTAGVSKTVRTMRPDKATGKMVHGKRETDPSKEGQEIVWSDDARDWVLPSKKAADAGAKAAMKEPEGERRPWASQAQAVQGTPVPNDANTQKAQAAAAEPAKKGPSLTQRNAGHKSAIGKLFGKAQKKTAGDDDGSEAD